MPAPALPLICALLRGESPAWPSDAGADAVTEFLREARHHGVTPLLDARFRAMGSAPKAQAGGPDSVLAGAHASWPESIRTACREDALMQAMTEHRRQPELARVLSALADAGVDALVFKGAALAHTHYANAALRPRADTDVLVAPHARDAALAVLRALGHRRTCGPASTYVGYQTEMTRVDPHGGASSIDLHWRLSNAQSFAWLFDFEELAAASLAVDALGPGARRPGDAHALAIALMHRAGNNAFVGQGSGDRLIWLHDFRLLAEAMSDDETSRFVTLVRDKRIAAIAIEGLRRCTDALPSTRVDALIVALERRPMAASGAAFLRAGRLRREWLELRAVPTVRTRLAYLAGRLLPDAEYMRERFPGASGGALPLLHARRWLGRLAPRGSARER